MSYRVAGWSIVALLFAFLVALMAFMPYTDLQHATVYVSFQNGRLGPAIDGRLQLIALYVAFPLGFVAGYLLDKDNWW